MFLIALRDPRLACCEDLIEILALIFGQCVGDVADLETVHALSIGQLSVHHQGQSDPDVRCRCEDGHPSIVVRGKEPKLVDGGRVSEPPGLGEADETSRCVFQDVVQLRTTPFFRECEIDPLKRILDLLQAERFEMLVNDDRRMLLGRRDDVEGGGAEALLKQALIEFEAHVRNLVLLLMHKLYEHLGRVSGGQCCGQLRLGAQIARERPSLLQMAKPI